MNLFPRLLRLRNIKTVTRRFYGAEALNGDGGCARVYEKTTCLSVSGCRSNFQNTQTITEISQNETIPMISFHGRSLPNHLTSLESAEGQEIFKESLVQGNAHNFFPLITNFASQSDVSMCGPASLAMVLNALKLDPMRVWRRPWRWWSDEMFACCEGSLEVMKNSGVTLEFFDRIAKNQRGITVETRFADGIEAFRAALMKSSTESNVHVIVSFGRVALGQTGIGHFSPIAAMHPEKDLALVLDVARFKYPPYWVKIEELYEAMKGIDPETGKPRGYSVVNRSNEC